jgi:hypothetical protein
MQRLLAIHRYVQVNGDCRLRQSFLDHQDISRSSATSSTSMMSLFATSPFSRIPAAC